MSESHKKENGMEKMSIHQSKAQNLTRLISSTINVLKSNFQVTCKAKNVQISYIMMFNHSTEK
ncbi:hypothetical protein Fmac_002317 [Flemingia macrophylla]|uniref:Uncharacterized protein n=1 Tax=Flemingia macrophylla TaxID=520843 RepID=A0ABD1NKY1_9FABA